MSFEEFDFAEVHSDGADKQLDAIRAGGQRLVIMARQEIGEALTALDDGDFPKSSERLAQGGYWIGLLAQAQQGIAVASGSRLIPAADVKIGMILTDVGEVSDVIVEDCASRHCRRHIGIKVGEHELKFHGDQCVYVVDGV